jgi:hypothetical protein
MTLRRQVVDFIYPMTKKHAHGITEVFEEVYTQHVGVAQVITSTTQRVRDGSYGDGLITKFKKNNLPRIAISMANRRRLSRDNSTIICNRLHGLMQRKAVWGNSIP